MVTLFSKIKILELNRLSLLVHQEQVKALDRGN